jgi:hypothetical protein
VTRSIERNPEIVIGSRVQRVLLQSPAMEFDRLFEPSQRTG